MKPCSQQRRVWSHERASEDLFKALAQDPTRWGQRALTAIQDGVATAITGTPIGTLQKAEAGSRGPYMAAHEAEGIEAGVFFADYPEQRPQRKG